jgi:hypothetical protein
VQKPTDLFGRDDEWARLVAFAEATSLEPRLALVYGRRRQGKSLLLTTLCEQMGVFYWEALDGEEAQNLASIAAAWSSWVRASAPIRFASWEEVISALMTAGEIAGRSVPVVLDEIPRIISRTPEVPSLLQRALGPGRRKHAAIPLVLCGSAFGEMRRLIDGPRHCAVELLSSFLSNLLISAVPPRSGVSNRTPILHFVITLSSGVPPPIGRWRAATPLLMGTSTDGSLTGCSIRRPVFFATAASRLLKTYNSVISNATGDFLQPSRMGRVRGER